MKLPTWSVVAMIDEPAPLVAAFAQHMLAIGAAQVDLFLDAPNPQAQALLAATDGCRITLCDAAFWAASEGGARPSANTARQFVVAGIAMQRAATDWLLHCDCDEFLRKPGRLLQELADLPDEVTHLTLRMAERVSVGAQTGLYAGAFRRMDWAYGDIGADLHGDKADYFHAGLSGHMMGKSFTRTGRGLRPTVHYAVSDASSDYSLGTPGRYATGTRMLHFDGMTPLHYAIKLMRRVLDPRSNTPRPISGQRAAQIEHLRGLVSDPAALAVFVRRMTTLTQRQAAILRERRLLEDTPFRPQTDATVAGLLTPAAIDRRLRGRHRVLLERHAPQLLDEALWTDLVRAAVASGEDDVGRAEL